MISLKTYLEQLDWSLGQTKHEQTHKCFLKAASLGLKPSEAYKSVYQKIVSVGGDINLRDIKRQLERAYEYVQGGKIKPATGSLSGKAQGKTKAKHRDFDFDVLRKYVKCLDAEMNRDWFLSRSPCLPNSAREYLQLLYRPEEKVAILEKVKQREPLIWDQTSNPIIPNSSEDGILFQTAPVDGQPHEVDRLKTVTNPEGKTWRAKEAVTSYPYLLLESDYEEEQYPGVGKAWLAFLAIVPVPIVSIVGSGNKSIHALVRVPNPTKEGWDQYVQSLKRFFTLYGADHQAISSIRATRLPFCMREDREQQLYYCNPAADRTPIYKQSKSEDKNNGNS